MSKLQEAEGMKGLPKGWTQKSLMKFSKSLTGKEGTKEKFFERCVKKMTGKIDNPEGFCASVKDELHGSTYWRGKGKTPQEAGKDVKAHQNVKQEHTMKPLVENFLKQLYTDMRPHAEEWNGPNIPFGDDADRPNLVRKCMTLESDRMKINCLRKLQDQAAMNPQYRVKIDRWVDAITQTYEPTDHPGTIPGNEFKTGSMEDAHKQAVGGDLIEGVLDKVGRSMGKEIGKSKKKPDTRSIQQKIAIINKMKMKQCSKRPTPELKAKCAKFYDIRIAQAKAKMATESYLEELFDSSDIKAVKQKIKEFDAKMSKLRIDIKLLFSASIEYIAQDVQEYYEKNTDLDMLELQDLMGFGMGGKGAKRAGLGQLYKMHKRNIDNIIKSYVVKFKRNLPKIKKLAKSYIMATKDMEKYLKQNEEKVQQASVQKWYQVLGGYTGMVRRIQQTAKEFEQGLKIPDVKVIRESLAIDWLVGKSKDLYKHGCPYFPDSSTNNHFWFEY